MCAGDLVLAQWKEPDLECSAEGRRRPDGVRQGAVVVWDPQRERLLVQGQYAEGERVGTWKLWNPDGTLREQRMYEEGRPVRAASWYPTGTQRSYTLFLPGSVMLVLVSRWGENGQLLNEIECLEVMRPSLDCRSWRRRYWAASGELFFDEVAESSDELREKSRPYAQRIEEERLKGARQLAE